MPNGFPRRSVLDDAVRSDLDENGPSTIADVSQRVGWQHGTIARVLERLVADGIVERVGETTWRWQQGAAYVYCLAGLTFPTITEDAETPSPRMAACGEGEIERLARTVNWKPVRRNPDWERVV